MKFMKRSFHWLGTASLVLSTHAMAALPKQEQITEGSDGNLFDTMRNVGQEGFSLGFLVVTVFGILALIGGLIWAFNESKKRGEWGTFGMVLGVGIVMVVIVIWLANYGDPIMSGS